MTKAYLVLIRGINVGGKNTIAMTELKLCFEQLNYTNVRTYIATGNLIMESDKSVAELTEEIQTALPKMYYSDVIFMMDITSDKAIKIFKPREGIDTIWQGDGVIYSQRLAELRTKSRLSKIVADPLYKHMTIRTWGTTTKLLALMSA
jgi:uncharacterized protein (DUF1697 family)